MIISRKKFLQVTGISVLCTVAERLSGTLAGAMQSTQPPVTEALTASRWAMIVDLPKCSQADSCTKCIEACHTAHNVPQIKNQSHRIEWIWRDSYEKAFPSEKSEYLAASIKKAAVPLFCNQCDNPPCVRVCPAQATWKQEDGIVVIDWHRCIGCRYCMAACPYGSRSFNWVDPRPHIAQMNPDFPTRTIGVVEKCNFCEERLAKGGLPACVEACPEKALTFGDLADSNSAVRELLESRFSIRRKLELGTNPQIFYIV